MWWNGLWNGPWWEFPWVWIFPVIFLVLLALFLFRGPGRFMCGGHGSRDREESAREILDRRFARGEISREDYQRKEILETIGVAIMMGGGPAAQQSRSRGTWCQVCRRRR